MIIFPNESVGGWAKRYGLANLKSHFGDAKVGRSVIVLEGCGYRGDYVKFPDLWGFEGEGWEGTPLAV